MKSAVCRACGDTFPHDQRRRTTCDPCQKRIQDEQSSTWARKNRQRSREIKTAWRLRNPDQMKTARANWKANNPKKVKANKKRRLKLQPEMNANNVQRNRARRHGVQILSFTGEQLRSRLAYYGNNCWICGYPADGVDHVKPVTRGGPHLLANIRPACLSCNASKHDDWPFDLQAIRLRGIREPVRVNPERASSTTECIHGHVFTEETTYVNPRTGHRYCKVCARNQEAVRSA